MHSTRLLCEVLDEHSMLAEIPANSIGNTMQQGEVPCFLFSCSSDVLTPSEFEESNRIIVKRPWSIDNPEWSDDGDFLYLVESVMLSLLARPSVDGVACSVMFV